MMSRLKRLIRISLAASEQGPWDSRCVLRKMHRSTWPELVKISSAIDKVDALGEWDSLVAKLRATHPIGRHLEQHDERALDVLTEACAFAWAATSNLGTPAFCTREGTPDIRCDSGWWVEAKAIHGSDVDKQRRRLMRETGEPIVGVVTDVGPGLVKKFDAAFADAQVKFNRQSGGSSFVVFFNLMQIDTPQIPIRSEVLAEVVDAVMGLSNHAKGVEAVVCYAYDWSQPLGGTMPSR